MLDDDIVKLKDDWDSFSDLFQSMYLRMQEMIEEIKRGKTTMKQNADIGYITRNIGGIADELKKECNAKCGLIGKMISFAQTKEGIINEENPKSVRGKLGLAVPMVSQTPNVPKRNTDEYYRLCEALRIPKDVAMQGVMQFHYKTLQDITTELVTNGKKPLAGLEVTRPHYFCQFRKS